MLRILRIIPQVKAASRLLNVSSKKLLHAPNVLKFYVFNIRKAQCFSSQTPTSNPMLGIHLSESDISLVCEGDAETEKLLRVIILEVDILRQDGHLVPDTITLDEWREMLLLKSRHSRMRYLSFLFKNEKRKENKLRKAEDKRRERNETEQVINESGHIKYGFGGNTIFIRVYDSTMDSYLNKNLMNAALYSQHIVIDCSYNNFMTRMEQRNCAKQLCILFAENRNHPQPFHIQFCNADPNSYMIQCLNKYMPTMYELHYPMFITPKSYTELYDKERLVYLTPHCRQDLVEWNHDDIYIIGAMVDKSNPKPLSLAKAKEDGLRMAKLPLERHLVWGTGSSKNLTLNQVTSILLDVRHTGDWTYGFRHIPRRKVIEGDMLINETPQSGHKFRSSQETKKFKTGDVLLSSNIIKKIKNKVNVDFNKLYD